MAKSYATDTRQYNSSFLCSSHTDERMWTGYFYGLPLQHVLRRFSNKKNRYSEMIAHPVYELGLSLLTQCQMVCHSWPRNHHKRY